MDEKDCYAHMNLPQPAIPALQTLTLLLGQTALVTGASSGIGRAIAVAHRISPTTSSARPCTSTAG
jgi:NADPH:quinone reductase-like Zn-dependent oxidoreductase